MIEQLVGELGEEREDSSITKLEDTVWRVHGSTLLEDFAKMTGISLSCEDYDTFNGLILNVLGSIPEQADNMEVAIPGLELSEIEIHKHKVKSAIVSMRSEQ